MVNLAKNLIFQRIIIYFFLIALTLSTYFYFNVSIPLWFAFIIIFIKMITKEAAMMFVKNSLGKIFSITSIIISVVYAMILILCIVITPFSAYSFFFNSAQRSFPYPLADSLIGANIFFFLFLFLGLLFSSIMIDEKSFHPLSTLFALIAGLLLIIYQSLIIFIIFLFFIILSAIINYKKKIVYIFPAIIVCGLLALLVFAFNPEPGGRAIIGNFLFPELRNMINQNFPDIPLVLAIPGYGTSINSLRLGGRSVLTSTPVFDVHDPYGKTLYLRQKICDRYTGTGWISTRKPINIENSEELMINPDKLGRAVRVQILSELWPNIPVSLNTKAFGFRNKIYSYEKEYWSGITLNQGLAKNEWLTLYEDSATSLSQIIDTESFLAVPANLPNRIKNLALSFKKQGENQEQLLTRIQNYLSNNFVYTLDAPVIKKGEDFLDEFLFEDKLGYCTHFATAFTILARLNQIPVRFATGYLVYFGIDDVSKIVTGRAAHAWPEYWSTEKGWQIWEATQAVNIDNYRDLPMGYIEYLRQNSIGGNEIILNQWTRQQLRDILGIELGDLSNQNKVFFISSDILILVILLFLIVLIVLGIRFLIPILKRKFFKKAKILEWQLYVNKIINQSEGVPKPEKGGWLKWQEDMTEVYCTEGQRLQQLTSILLKAAYSSPDLAEVELNLLKEFSQISLKDKMCR